MNSSAKAALMTKDETMLLVQLVAANSVLTSKATNAANDKMEEEDWLNLSNKFNSSIISFPRTPADLRLRWENLKKSARKRCANMRSSHNKTGVGKDYFPPDEVLDKVASLIGTYQGFSVEFGGDATKQSNEVIETKRKHKMEEEKCKAHILRENALAEYLRAKKRKLDLENEEKEVSIAKLKLELENARLENLKLKSDLVNLLYKN